MKEKLINIRTDKFSKEEIRVIENCMKEWGYDFIVEIVYFGESSYGKFRCFLHNRGR